MSKTLAALVANTEHVSEGHHLFLAAAHFTRFFEETLCACIADDALAIEAFLEAA